MATLITDDFDRDDAATLGDDWEEVDGTDASIVANRAQIMQGSASDVGAVRHVDSLDSADHYAEAVFASRGGGGTGTVAGTCVRFAASAKTFYYGWVRDNGNWTVGKVVDGTRTALASFTPAVRQSYPISTRLEVEGDQLRQIAAGSTVSGTFNEVTDTSITSGVQVGMHGHPAAADQPRMDDFEAGILGEPPAGPTPPYLQRVGGGVLYGPGGGFLRRVT